MRRSVCKRSSSTGQGALVTMFADVHARRIAKAGLGCFRPLRAGKPGKADKARLIAAHFSLWAEKIPPFPPNSPQNGRIVHSPYISRKDGHFENTFVYAIKCVYEEN